MRVFLLIIIIFSGIFSFAQEELGLPSIKNFGQEDFNSQVQNFFVTQDKNGIIYVGNKEGLLEYRGAVWRKYQLPNKMDVKTILIADNGLIYVGGIDDFGYFSTDSVSDEEDTASLLEFHSFRDLVDSTINNVGDIIYTAKNGENIYFGSEKYLFAWNGKKLKNIPLEYSILGFVKDNGKLYLKIKKYGLLYIDNLKLKTVRNTSQILVNPENVSTIADDKNTKVKMPAMTRQIKYNNEWNLAFSAKKGLFLFKIDKDIFIKKPYTFNSSFYSGNKKNISEFIKLSNDFLAFATLDQGIIITDNRGNIVRKIDTKSGLIDNKVNYLYFDRQNHLWAALDQGISRIKLNDSWQLFKKTSEVGILESINRFNGKLYFTARSLFSFEKPEEKGYPWIYKKHVEPLVNKGCYNLMNFDAGDKKMMIIITDDGITSVDASGNFKLIAPGFIWNTMCDKQDPNRIWIGLDNGLTSVYYKNGDFIIEGRIPGVNIRCQFLEQDNEGTVWAANIFSEVVKLSNPVFVNNKIRNFDLKIYSADDGLPEDNAIYPKQIDNKMVFGTGEGLFYLNKKTNRFEPYDGLGDIFANHGKGKGKQCHRIYQDSKKNIWIISKNHDETRLQIYKLTADKQGVYKPEKVFENEGKGDIFNAIYEDGNSIWFGGVSSLIKYTEKENQDSIPLFFPHIYFVTAGNDTIFTGYEFSDNRQITKQNATETKIIKYKNNKLIFYYAALLRNNEEPTLYSYKLEGFDDEWSKWDTRSEERFTNLPEGDYVFRIKAKDRMGNISPEATYKFTILPPWYRTIWAYIGYLLFFVAFVWGAITVSTRSLKKIIREATAEIQAQKDELEEKNQNIMDSIRYAKRIQEAVTPTESQMKKFFPEHFVLWRPRDIVSGDFFWMMHKNDKVIIAAADCTGHGVPGAFMSIMGISFLNQIANMPEVQNAADALNHLRHNVITSLNQEGSETDTKDGMDISLCVYDFKEMTMEFSGAYNPLYMIRNEELSVIKADRMPVGIHERMDRPFTNNKFTIMKGDIFYILSDGYIDQFGGPKGKKFMTKRFKELILKIHKLPMGEQSRILEEELLKWRGDIEQIDDIIIIGIRVV